MGWLSCYGNHEALNQGVGMATAGIAGALVGASKPVALPESFDHDRALELFTDRPEAFLAGPSHTITGMMTSFVCFACSAACWAMMSTFA